MNQGKLDVVKQEMARVSIDILGISELKWMEMGEFITMGKNLLEEMEQTSQSTKKSEMQYLDAISKTTERSLFHFQGKPFNISVIQVQALTSNAEEAEVEQFYEDLQDLLELTPKKDVLTLQGTGMQKKEVKNT